MNVSRAVGKDDKEVDEEEEEGEEGEEEHEWAPELLTYLDETAESLKVNLEVFAKKGYLLLS